MLFDCESPVFEPSLSIADGICLLPDLLRWVVRLAIEKTLPRRVSTRLALATASGVCNAHANSKAIKNRESGLEAMSIYRKFADSRE